MWIIHFLYYFTDGIKTRTHQIQLEKQFNLCLSFRKFLQMYQIGHFMFAVAMELWLSPRTPRTEPSVCASCTIHTLPPAPHSWPWALAKRQGVLPGELPCSATAAGVNNTSNQTLWPRNAIITREGFPHVLLTARSSRVLLATLMKQQST